MDHCQGDWQGTLEAISQNKKWDSAGADPGLWKGGAQGHRGCKAAQNFIVVSKHCLCISATNRHWVHNIVTQIQWQLQSGFYLA